jgi:hypothetical protein
MRVLTLLARHGTHQYGDAIGNLEDWFARHLPDAQHDLIIADNTLEEGYAQILGSGRDLIGSSNENWEYSAWDAAVAYVGQELEDYDLVHFATSAFRALGTHHLDRFDAHILRLLSGRRVALGHIDQYPRAVSVRGVASQAWLRSSWMFMPPRELRLLGSLVSISDRRSVFSGDARAPFGPDAPLSSNYQDYLLGWITGDGTGIGKRWHSRFDLTDDSLAGFEAKALAILNEHLLTIRLRTQGCAIVDATWLSTRCSEFAVETALDSVPSWRWQVNTREAVLRQPLSFTARAEFVAGECSEIGRLHGKTAGRRLFWHVAKNDPSLLAARPVLGAFCRLHGLRPMR